VDALDISYLYPVCEAAAPKASPDDYGRLPSDGNVQQEFAEHPSNVIVLHEQTYNPVRPNRPEGPYFPWRRGELERFASALCMPAPSIGSGGSRGRWAILRRWRCS